VHICKRNEQGGGGGRKGETRWMIVRRALLACRLPLAFGEDQRCRFCTIILIVVRMLHQRNLEDGNDGKSEEKINTQSNEGRIRRGRGKLWMQNTRPHKQDRESKRGGGRSTSTHIIKQRTQQAKEAGRWQQTIGPEKEEGEQKEWRNHRVFLSV
jgi:hypothetical protein